jgi:prepilin-type processing-associated H-X9-DG protein
MKTLLAERKVCGLTLIEVLIVIAVVVILGVLGIGGLHMAKSNGMRVACLNNLKQLDVAFRLWSDDHTNLYPMNLSTNLGGTREFIDAGETYLHLLPMSNELSTPYFLHCPADSGSGRIHASMFSSSVYPGVPEAVPFTGNINLSYFIGVDVTPNQPEMVISGDRNLTLNGTSLSPGLHSFRTNDLVGWSSEMHKNQGNVLFVDGSATTSQGSLGLFGTNRAAIP